MITAEDFVLELDNNEEKQNFKLGIVTGLFENKTAKIKFDGEEAASEKQYAYLNNYIPVAGDRVLLAAVGGTYIVQGKVNFDVMPDIPEEIDRYIFDQLVKFNAGFISADKATFNGNVEVNNNIDVDGAINSNTVTTENIETDTLTANNITANVKATITECVSNKLTVNNEAKISDATVQTYFSHTGSYLRFFGSPTFATRRSIANLNTSADSAAVISKVNEILQAFKAYGLLS